MTEICMLVHQAYERDGRVRRYVESLLDSGTAVDVLCVRDHTLAPTRHAEGLRVFTIPLERGYKNRASYLVEYVVALLLYSIWLCGLYARNRYRVIHVHNMPDFLVFAAFIPKLFGAKIVLDIHDPMPEFYMSKFGVGESGLFLNMLRWQERLSASWSSSIITANPNFKQNLDQRGISGERIIVVNNVADSRVFCRPMHEKLRRQARDSFTLLYPGTIAPRYNLDVAVRAMPALVAIIPNLRLRIIGHRVGHVDELEALAEQLHVSEAVEFLPVVPIDEVPRQMALADIGIYTAIGGPHMSIATPTKVLEYVTMGLPVVASQLPILEELFDESALMLFEPGNVTQFTQCVLALYADTQLREQLVRNADQSFVHNHDWQHEWAAYSELLDTLLDSQKAVPRLI